MKQKYVGQMALAIDYDLFTTDEIVKIFNFYSYVEAFTKHHGNKTELIKLYHEYKTIINNLSLQKKYDKNFEKITNISIYKIITSLNERY